MVRLNGFSHDMQTEMNFGLFQGVDYGEAGHVLIMPDRSSEYQRTSDFLLNKEILPLHLFPSHAEGIREIFV